MNLKKILILLILIYKNNLFRDINIKVLNDILVFKITAENDTNIYN